MKKIFYQHIPKTGGQTLATRIASGFPLGCSSIMGQDLTYPTGVDRLLELLESHDFVERHVNGPVLRNVDGLDILVTVREPVSQIVSNYLHIQREPASPLYRPVKLLTPKAFFAQFGDLLANHQTRYFISAYNDMGADVERLTSWMAMMLHCFDRVSWFVPTEQIDEFCLLWQLETGKAIQLVDERINMASVSDESRKELEKIVAGMPELYSLDIFLWQVAKQRYESYKRHILNKVVTKSYPNNWGYVWADGENGIWLGRGWHQPQMSSYGYTYWAGPERLSEIRFKRNSDLRYLVFSIIVFCGVYESDLQFVSIDGAVLAPFNSRIDDQEVEYVVDLVNIGETETTIFLKVPEVWSPVMVDSETTDTSRRSVATCKWALTSAPPFLDGDKPLCQVHNLNNLHAGDGHGLDI